MGENPVFASTTAPGPAAAPPNKVAESQPVIAGPKPAPPPASSNQKSQKSAPAAKARRKTKQKAPQIHPPAPPKEEAKDSSASVFSLRDGRYNLLWVALFAIGLSGGLYFSRQTHPQPPASAPNTPLAQLTPPVDDNRSAAPAPHTSQPDERSRAPAPAAEIKPAAAKPESGNMPPRPQESSDLNLKRRLEGKSSLVILGLDAPAIQELSLHPGRLPELVQSGSLFTVPRGAAVQIQAEQDGILKVLLLDSSMSGREGWVPASQVAPRYRSDEPKHPAIQ